MVSQQKYKEHKRLKLTGKIREEKVFSTLCTSDGRELSERDIDGDNLFPNEDTGTRVKLLGTLQEPQSTRPEAVRRFFRQVTQILVYLFCTYTP